MCCYGEIITKMLLNLFTKLILILHSNQRFSIYIFFISIPMSKHLNSLMWYILVSFKQLKQKPSQPCIPGSTIFRTFLTPVSSADYYKRENNPQSFLPQRRIDQFTCLIFFLSKQNGPFLNPRMKSEQKRDKMVEIMSSITFKSFENKIN